MPLLTGSLPLTRLTAKHSTWTFLNCTEAENKFPPSHCNRISNTMSISEVTSVCFQITRQAYGDEGNGIDREAYKSGYCLFCFNVTPELSEGHHFNLVKQGSLRLELHFPAPLLPTTINVVCYAEFSNLTHVDKARNVLLQLLYVMNNQQIESILRADPLTGPVFQGVFPRDRLPRRVKNYPQAFTFNKDEHHKEGSHWLAVYLDAQDSGGIFRFIREETPVRGIYKLFARVQQILGL